MISVGDKLDGKYLIDRRLGGGGFGEVFLARDETIPHRKVAIKVLARPRPDDDHGDLVWEMRTLAEFHHPHVVAFYHHFTDAECLCLVMEFCPGGSLHDRLTAAGHIPATQCFVWGLDLCDTLAFVHGKGFVHHDIKPANILFTAEGALKLGDFGVANRYAGTALYLPPEMLLGEPVSRTDPRVDLYALGLTLLELIIGRHPFAGLARDEALQARVTHDFVPSDPPRWVQEILLKATHPTPELRFQTAEDFAEAIQGRHVPYVFDGNRIKAHVLAEKAEVAIRRKRWKAAERLVTQALQISGDCVAALLAAGRCQLLLRRVDQANEYFAKAVAISPRTQVQKELGWMALEQGRLPAAISLLTDHLQRNASDYEAYNLLLKCFYLSDRFEIGEDLATTLVNEKAPNDCFQSNRFLFRLLSGDLPRGELEGLALPADSSPFLAYNLMVFRESPSAWAANGGPTLKSKLLFQEYRFLTATRAARPNTLAVRLPHEVLREDSKPIVTIGSLRANDIALDSRSVSRRHCAIVNYPGEVWLYDLESTVGTEVDGQPLVGRVFLDGVHDVAIGGVQVRIAARSDLLV